MLRKLRGALGMAFTWAVVWGLGGLLLAIVAFIVTPALGRIAFWALAPALVARTAALGFVGGGAFAVVLGTIHRRKRLGELGTLRMALWGALAGVAMPLVGLVAIAGVGGVPIRIVLGPALLIFGGLGAATSIATIKLAQRAGDGLDSADPERLLLR